MISTMSEERTLDSPVSRLVEAGEEGSTEKAPLISMKAAAKQAGITVQALRLYEKHGFLPRRGRYQGRFYSSQEVRWLCCVREMIHLKKISIEAIKKLLEYAQCWEIRECLPGERAACPVPDFARLPVPVDLRPGPKQRERNGARRSREKAGTVR